MHWGLLPDQASPAHYNCSTEQEVAQHPAAGTGHIRSHFSLIQTQHNPCTTMLKTQCSNINIPWPCFVTLVKQRLTSCPVLRSLFLPMSPLVSVSEFRCRPLSLSCLRVLVSASKVSLFSDINFLLISNCFPMLYS